GDRGQDGREVGGRRVGGRRVGGRRVGGRPVGLERDLGERRHARNGAQASAGRSCTWSCIVTSLTISYSFVPDGTFTSTVSPSSWPRSDLPIGEGGGMRPTLGSDSSGVTIS